MMLVKLHQNIYVRRHTRYIAAEQLIKKLHKKNVKLVVNVTPTVDSMFAQSARAAGIMYHHVPMLDNSYVPVNDLRQLVPRVVEEVRRGNSVMIHCNQGNNRSPLIAILAIIELTGCQPTDAIRQAREVRPGILTNKSFERYVIKSSCQHNI